MALFSHSTLPRAMEVIIDICKDLSKEGKSRSESSVGGTQETRAPHGSSLHLAETEYLGLIIYSQATKVPSSVDLIRRRFSPLQSAFHIPSSQTDLCSHSGLVSRTMGGFIVRFLCSHVRSRPLSHLVPRPRFRYTRADDQVRG